MESSFFDATLNDIILNTRKTSIGIPIIDDLRSESAASSSDLFIITGHAQSYKTTFAVDIMKKLMDNSVGSTAVWVDCNFKFPIDCMKEKEIDLERVQRVRCRSSEQIIFTLQKLHFLVQSNHTNYTFLNTIVIDGLNSSYWIDQNTNKQMLNVNPKKPRIFTQMKQIIERQLVAELGLKVIVTLDYLGDFSISQKISDWSYSKDCCTQFLECKTIGPGKGYIRCNETCDKFKIGEKRSFEWGKRSLVQHVNAYMDKEDEYEQKLQKIEDNAEDGNNIVI